MNDRALERRLRRINGEAALPRQAWAFACLAALTALGLGSGLGAHKLTVALLAVFCTLVWLRRYERDRPCAGALVSRLAVGAFLGGCIAGVFVDPPGSAHTWLLAPAASGGPPALLVLLAALCEDLLQSLRKRATR